MILMILSVYNTYLSAVSIVNMNVILPMIIGVIIGSFVFIKIIKLLLDRFHIQTLFGIIGFSLGSIFILYPTYHLDFISIFYIFLILFLFII